MTIPIPTAPQIDTATGRLRGVRQVLSPHQDARPGGQLPELVIVHGISLPPGEFGGPWIDRLFTGGLPADAHPYFAKVAALRVSAHLMIARDGGLTQYVPFHLRAWHAGVSEYRGRTACNDFSIGIELEGVDDVPYESAQYAALAGVIHALLGAYPGLDRDRVVGHSDVAPGRKTDPGLSFDWARLRADVARTDHAPGDA
ncbi:MAG: 1,6-anhydro-N-acetylmuramyl-L-alanine amidase AmpD [Steroidobacteraceae bacterium]